ncbi:MAG: hypothetical protein KF788_16335 [Piscinibacter sp.]|nr:hypothetical protein [Piscinibacter sp.]
MSETHRLVIESRSAFHDALRAAFGEAAAKGCREIWIVDSDFADWPLNERAVVEHLTQWASAHRRLTVVARHFDEVVRRHARWVEWRRQWAHVVHCRTNNELEAGQMPTLLLAPGLTSVRLFDVVQYRGVATDEVRDALLWREEVDAVLQRSEEGFPATTLGL